jgi:carboxypeptidase C (cathepsin A)
MLGAFTENGPYWLKYHPDEKPRVKLEYNPHSWNNQANVLYLD